MDQAREIENRGYPAIYCPSLGDGVSLCAALAHVNQAFDEFFAIRC